MGKTSAIEWCDASWNPWRGCHKVSQGCARCYMFREQKRYGRNPNVVVRSKTTFNDPLKWIEHRKIFTCSWSDWFIEEADEWRDEAWDIVRQTPQHTYQILTKRPENILERLPWDWGNGWGNVWLGVSTEDQPNADERIPILLTIPAKVRFLSCEPLLGPINLKAVTFEHNFLVDALTGKEDTFLGPEEHWGKIHWVIVGGESGPKARYMNPLWAKEIRDQCYDAGVPFFMKQMGGWPDKVGDIDKFPDGLRVREMP